MTAPVAPRRAGAWRRRCIALVLLMAAGVVPVQALQPDRDLRHALQTRWSVSDGLPQAGVYSLAQDVDGYLWVGTQGGLGRFDGIRFSNHTESSEPGLPSHAIRTLLAGRGGRLWIGSYKGLAVREAGRISPVPAADAERWPALDIRALAEDGDGALWAGTASGLFRLSEGALHPVADGPRRAFALLHHGGALWVGAEDAVHVRGGDGVRVLPLPASPGGSAVVTGLAMFEGRVWAASTGGLFVLQRGAWQRVEGAPDGQRVDLLHADRDGNLWAGGGFGLLRIRDGGIAEHAEPGSPGAIAQPTTAFEDHEGNLWIGSVTAGLTMLRDGWSRRYGTASGLNDEMVWAVSPDPSDDGVWVGTNDGVSRLHGGRSTLVVPGTALGPSEATAVLAEHARVWIGTRDGVYVLEREGPHAGRIWQPPAFAALPPGQRIAGFVRGGDGALWVGSKRDGLYRWDGTRLQQFGRAHGLPDPRVRYLHQDGDGAMLVGTPAGLYELRGERFLPVGRDAGLPADADIFTIAGLGAGSLVVGTLSEKLYFRHDGRWHALGQAEGMPRNLAFFIGEHAGFVWIAGEFGISRVPRTDLAALAEGRIDQVRGEMLLSESGTPGSGQLGYCCNGNGNGNGFLRGDTLWLPSHHGVVALDTDRIVPNAVPPPVAIERVQVGEQWRGAGTVREAELPAASRDLGFQFAVLSYQDPKSNQAEYRLRGYDREWHAIAPLVRDTRYTNLPPGDYVLEVRGRNNAGIASVHDARLPFSIRPHFHETPAFKALLAALALALVYVGYRYQRIRHARQRAVLESLVRERTSDLEESNRRLGQSNAELASVNDKLEQATLTDPLTGLRNRRYVSNQIPTDLAYYDRRMRDGGPVDQVLVFALIDVDHFKAVNDTHGHRAGDVVLQQVAAVLTAMVRTGDYVVRWGGEEFLLVFRPMPMEQLAILGERMRSAIAAHRFDIGDGKILRLTASIGLAEYPLFRADDGASLGWEAMVELADQAMYHVKTHGRDGWGAFRPNPSTRMDTLLGDLQAGAEALVARGELQLLGSADADPPEAR